MLPGFFFLRNVIIALSRRHTKWIKLRSIINNKNNKNPNIETHSGILPKKLHNRRNEIQEMNCKNIRKKIHLIILILSLCYFFFILYLEDEKKKTSNKNPQTMINTKLKIFLRHEKEWKKIPRNWRIKKITILMFNFYSRHNISSWRWYNEE